MVARPLEIHVDAESETAKVLAQANERPLLVVVEGGHRFNVELARSATGDDVGTADASPATDPSDPWADYDPERVRAALKALVEANIFEGLDVEQLKRELREQRGQHSIGRPEW